MKNVYVYLEVTHQFIYHMSYGDAIIQSATESLKFLRRSGYFDWSGKLTFPYLELPSEGIIFEELAQIIRKKPETLCKPCSVFESATSCLQGRPFSQTTLISK